MTGSPLRKAARLSSHLLAQPGYLFAYARHNFFPRRSPIALELPWISYGAIEFLEGFLRRAMTVFEYGSGGSTIFFARRCRSVVSTEDHAGWLTTVREELAGRNLRNVTLQHAEIDWSSTDAQQNFGYVNSIPARKFDVILVDGSDNLIAEGDGRQLRPVCFRHAEDFVEDNGIIVVDDSWAYPGLRETNRAKRHETFRSVGPCRPGVTSTDVFFY